MGKRPEAEWAPVVRWEGKLLATPIDGAMDKYPARLVEVAEGAFMLEVAFEDDAMRSPVWSRVALHQKGR